MSQQSHFLITVSGTEIKGYFQTKTGGSPTTTVTRDYDGGATVPDVSVGRITYADLRIGRRYDVKRDAEAVRRLRLAIGSNRTVTVIPTDANYKPAGAKDIYSCVLSGVSAPDTDSNGSGNAKFELTFGVKSIK